MATDAKQNSEHKQLHILLMGWIGCSLLLLHCLLLLICIRFYCTCCFLLTYVITASALFCIYGFCYFFCICWHWWIGFLHLMLMVRIGLSGYCFGLRVLVFRLVLGLLKPVFLVLQTLVLIFWAWFCFGSFGYILINPYLYLLFVLRYFFSLQIKNK